MPGHREIGGTSSPLLKGVSTPLPQWGGLSPPPMRGTVTANCVCLSTRDTEVWHDQTADRVLVLGCGVDPPLRGAGHVTCCLPARQWVGAEIQSSTARPRGAERSRAVGTSLSTLHPHTQPSPPTLRNHSTALPVGHVFTGEPDSPTTTTTPVIPNESFLFRHGGGMDCFSRKIHLGQCPPINLSSTHAERFLLLFWGHTR